MFVIAETQGPTARRNAAESKNELLTLFFYPILFEAIATAAVCSKNAIDLFEFNLEIDESTRILQIDGIDILTTLYTDFRTR